MFNRLSVKIFAPIVALMIGVGTILYFVVLRTIDEFAQQSIEKDLSSISRDLNNIVDQKYMEIIKSGKTGDPIAVRIKQVDCLDVLERETYSHNFKLIIFEKQTGKTLLSSFQSGQPGPKEIIQCFKSLKRGECLLPISDDEFHVRPFYFSPWDWTFLVMKNTQAYAGLSQQVHHVYLFSGIVLLIATMLLVAYLLRCIKIPISSIISSVSQGESPDYRGIYEFEFLSRAIGKMRTSLKNSEERYRTLINNAPIGIILAAEDGTIREANEAACYMTGYKDQEDLIQINVRDMYQDPDALAKVMDETRKNGIVGMEIDFKRKDNTPFTAFMTTVALTIDDEPMTLFMFEDITKQKEAERESVAMETKLRRAQKMEAVGMMVGGVAHDLNNILSGIVGYPDLLLLNLPEDSNLRKPIEEIQASGNRAALVVADLLTVARGAAATREVHDLNVLVKEYLDSPEYKKLISMHPGISCSQLLTANRADILCSSIHVKKCIMNLVINAAEAIREQGTILISTHNQIVDETSNEISELEKGEYVVFSIKDNGHGISEKELEHIFEPFYTKKVMGRSGTGLGLAVVWNTMEDHNGKVFVESSDAGTRFQLYFSVTQEQRFVQTVAESPENLRGNNEKILVVDDEPQLREIATDILANYGYQVEAVNSGEMAIDFVKSTPVDLILLDMLMEPGINGRRTYEEIIKLYPGQKAIIVSGFSESADVKAAIKQGAGGFIKKPYTMEELGLAIKKILNN